MLRVKHLLKIALLLAIIISSCSTDDSLTAESNKCRLTKYGLVITPRPSGNDTIYRNEVDYINSKIVVRSNFGSDPIINYWRLLSKDSAIYDQQNRIAKIYHINTRYTLESKIERYSEFIYDSFNHRPSKIKETRYQLSDNFSYIISEDIIYNEHNQIAQTLSINSTYRINTLTNYSYGENRNLSKIVQVNERTVPVSQNNEEIRVDSIVATFRNYDDKINPFQSLPFLNLKGFSDSPNNFTFRDELRYEDGEIRSAASSGYKFEYNDMGYPLIGEYDCQ